MRKLSKRYPIINGVQKLPDGREICNLNSVAGRFEYKRRVEDMYMRQGGICPICEKPMHLDMATFEHAKGKGMGNTKQDDRIEIDGELVNAAVCGLCNVEKLSRQFEWNNGRYQPVDREKSQ